MAQGAILHARVSKVGSGEQHSQEVKLWPRSRENNLMAQKRMRSKSLIK